MYFSVALDLRKTVNNIVLNTLTSAHALRMIEQSECRVPAIEKEKNQSA
jgi:hypothetical protein